ncbi:MAG: TolC family protein [Bacteroidetes bacterium]|nr:TolC family protein [Bacteroidota bacterium]
MKRLPVFVFFLYCRLVFSQAGEGLTLEECYSEAEKLWPLAANRDMLAEVTELKIKNVNTGFFPKADLSAQATYQSDVTEIDIEIPAMSPAMQAFSIDIPSPSKDQYKASVDISQMIYDGGLGKYMKKLEEASLQTDLQQIETELFKLREQINRFFFTALLFQENARVLSMKHDELSDRIKILESGVRNGILTESDADILKAELLKLEQQQMEIRHNRAGVLKMLGIMIQRELVDSIVLVLPESGTTLPSELSRPESELFDLQAQKIEAGSTLIARKRYPLLYGFGQFGYGRPGLNMMSDEFAPYYIVGAKLTWNIWDWKYNRREREVLTVQSDMITTQKESFEKSVQILLAGEAASIERLTALLEKDSEIIRLRSNITAASSSKLENGVITPADYVTDLNNETTARISYEMHKIQLAQARINYITLLGK